MRKQKKTIELNPSMDEQVTKLNKNTKGQNWEAKNSLLIDEVITKKLFERH